jgi:hypothetical protein
VGFDDKALNVTAPFEKIRSKFGVTASLNQAPAPSTPMTITCEYFRDINIAPLLDFFKFLFDYTISFSKNQYK